jgi:hypothetical protein
MGRIFSFVPDKAYKHRNGILPPLYYTPSSIEQEHIFLQNVKTTIWILIKLTAADDVALL